MTHLFHLHGHHNSTWWAFTLPSFENGKKNLGKQKDGKTSVTMNETTTEDQTRLRHYLKTRVKS